MPCFGKKRFTVGIYYRHESSIKTPYAVQRLAWLLSSLVSPTWRTSGGCWVIVTSVHSLYSEAMSCNFEVSFYRYDTKGKIRYCLRLRPTKPSLIVVTFCARAAFDLAQLFHEDRCRELGSCTNCVILETHNVF